MHTGDVSCCGSRSHFLNSHEPHFTEDQLPNREGKLKVTSHTKNACWHHLSSSSSSLLSVFALEPTVILRVYSCRHPGVLSWCRSQLHWKLCRFKRFANSLCCLWGWQYAQWLTNEMGLFLLLYFPRRCPCYNFQVSPSCVMLVIRLAYFLSSGQNTHTHTHIFILWISSDDHNLSSAISYSSTNLFHEQVLHQSERTLYSRKVDSIRAVEPVVDICPVVVLKATITHWTNMVWLAGQPGVVRAFALCAEVCRFASWSINPEVNTLPYGENLFFVELA